MDDQNTPAEMSGSEPSISANSPRKFSSTTAAIVIAVALAFGIAAAWYLGSFGGPSEQAQQVVKEAIQDANATFWVERDYEAAIEELEQARDEAVLAGVGAECRLKLELASKNLRQHQEEAMRLYAEVYNNTAYSTECRANALSDAMWHISSHTGDGSLSAQQVSEFVFTPQRFNILPVGTSLKTTGDVKKAAIIGFQKSYEMFPSHISGMMISRLYGVYMPSSRASWDKNSEYIEKIREWHDRAYPLLIEATAKSEHQDVFSTGVIYSLNNRFTGPLLDLALIGEMSKAEVYRAGEEVFSYADRFEDRSFVAPVFRALAAYKYVCAMALLEKRPFTSAQTQKVRTVLEYLYTLPQEDLANRKRLKTLASKSNDMCYEPMVYIGNNVDSRLKDTLINDIGGWTEENFK